MSTHDAQTAYSTRPKRAYTAPTASERQRTPTQQWLLGAMAAVLLGGGGLVAVVTATAGEFEPGALVAVGLGWTALLTWLAVGALRASR